MSNPKKVLSEKQIADQLPEGWEFIEGEIVADFKTGDFATGVKFVRAIGDAAERANHHPDVLLTYPEVTVSLSSHDVSGITSRDIDLATQINKLFDSI
ncbi:4a-hydroxytetrahydrobiopterin dehydratase [Corynebacterium guangdongense]|uniref:Putative pterin-4-alpha-carbinolamine dehydratase n=1 Tax=Corynebacterium guangdongense TaxID=1783348 RepID=A0ABU1ZU58_9CORY|nr:4a-hydroxytetrahydrobiopterin dehydratase [Corynebacterium guangdongense]MDR7328462.1 4a-hydroxytetrahydrobiopterin dehydratase [Corynebacterium guangdongense]WJZ17039.1 Putative pterin-4-alpha-carbinolamine dehydratase [Corynebacterium guangdongense]